MMLAPATTCIATSVTLLDAGIDAVTGPTVDITAPVSVTATNQAGPDEKRKSHLPSTAANAAATAVYAATTTTFSAVVSSLPGDAGISTSPAERWSVDALPRSTIFIAARTSPGPAASTLENSGD